MDIKAVGFASSYDVKTVSHTIATPSGEFQRFYEMTLNDPNVQEIVSVSDADGNVYYEVDYLAQDTIFDYVVNENDVQDNVPYIIFEKTVPRRFIKKQFVGSDDKIYTKIVFGNTSEANYNASLFNINPGDLVFPTQLAGLSSRSTSIQKLANRNYDPNDLLNVDSLGIAPTVGDVVTVSYTYGGGNIKANAGQLNRSRNVT